MRLTLVLTFLTLYTVANGQKAHPTARCDESLWEHVYAGDARRFEKPEDRLQIIERCKTVTGMIVSMKPEGDGDYHLQLRLDSGQPGLLNNKNRSGQRGNLVIETICMKTPTQRTALKDGSCTRFRQKFVALTQVRANIKKKKPTHVEITGAYITDMEHGWNEIHPVTSITLKPKSR